MTRPSWLVTGPSEAEQRVDEDRLRSGAPRADQGAGPNAQGGHPHAPRLLVRRKRVRGTTSYSRQRARDQAGSCSPTTKGTAVLSNEGRSRAWWSGPSRLRIAGESWSSLHLLATPWLYILLNSANPSHHCFFLMTTQGSARCVVILPELKEYTPNGAGWPRMRHRPASLRFARECDSSSFWAMVNDAGTLLADVAPSKESLGGSSFPFDESLVVFELTEVSTFFLVGVFTAILSSLVNFVV